ncbi:hypothetical protein HYY71_07250 [Candidatus Woesearchaeota archaeon]|nr:hypothetical protein [Candidatus Woesearchaeota archaeon]
MVTVVDDLGNEIDAEIYRRRIALSSPKKQQVESFVKGIEARLGQFDFVDSVDISDSGFRGGTWQEFERALDEFLVFAVYSSNLLDAHYKPSAQSHKLMAGANARRIASFRTHGRREMDEATYRLEKMMRLGLKVTLSEDDIRLFADAEEDCWEREPYHNYIKLANRRKGLGLPIDIAPEKRRILEESLKDYDIGSDPWTPGYSNRLALYCAAKRMGLALPPIKSAYLDKQIDLWVEQKEPEFSRMIDWDYWMATTNHGLKFSREEFIMTRFISQLHHLHRALAPD